MGEEACVLLGRLSAGILVLSLTIVTRVSAVTLYTPAEMFFVNGTVATLLCTFKSNEVVSSATSVNWKYTPLSGGTAQTLFYYHGGKSYPGSIPQFKDRVSWTGDINKKDGSITVANIQFVDNGTYSCEVKNPPDVDGTPSEINVRVVEQGHLPVSSSGVVAGAVIGAVLGVLLIIGIITYLVCRKRKRDKKKYNGPSESLMPPAVQSQEKLPPDTERLVYTSPSGQHQGPVIYAQLDHSGGPLSNKIIRKDAVVYADIQTAEGETKTGLKRGSH